MHQHVSGPGGDYFHSMSIHLDSKTKRHHLFQLDVSKNSGTPKSSIIIWFSKYKSSILEYPYFRKHPTDHPCFLRSLSVDEIVVGGLGFVEQGRMSFSISQVVVSNNFYFCPYLGK